MRHAVSLALITRLSPATNLLAVFFPTQGRPGQMPGYQAQPAQTNALRLNECLHCDGLAPHKGFRGHRTSAVLH